MSQINRVAVSAKGIGFALCWVFQKNISNLASFIWVSCRNTFNFKWFTTFSHVNKHVTRSQWNKNRHRGENYRRKLPLKHRRKVPRNKLPWTKFPRNKIPRPKITVKYMHSLATWQAYKPKHLDRKYLYIGRHLRRSTPEIKYENGKWKS
jgi:hypothetical protein